MTQKIRFWGGEDDEDRYMYSLSKMCVEDFTLFVEDFILSKMCGRFYLVKNVWKILPVLPCQKCVEDFFTLFVEDFTLSKMSSSFVDICV